MNLKIFILLSTAIILLTGCSDADNITGNDSQPHNYYDNTLLEHNFIQRFVSLNHNSQIADSLHLKFYNNNQMLLGRNSSKPDFDCLHYWNYSPNDTLDSDYSVFDKDYISILPQNMDRIEINYFVIDSDSSLAQFKRLFCHKRQFVNGKTDYVNMFLSEFNNLKLETRELMTIAILEVQAKHVLNLTNSYKQEYVAAINSSDTAIVNTAQRKYGDCYAAATIVGGCGYDLRTYYVPKESPYTRSQVRGALLEHVKSYFNLDSLKTESDSTKQIFQTIHATLPISVTASGPGIISGYFASLAINPVIIKNYIQGLANPSYIGAFAYRFAQYNPPAK